MGKDTLSITDNRTAKTYEIPISDGTIRAMDLRQIKVSEDDFGLMSYDPAFTNTASCRSAITFIDGEAGVLEHRGYPIEQLCEHSSYLEVAYLLVFGELPTKPQLERWVFDVTHHTFVHEDIKQFLQGFRYDAHPMGMLLARGGALSTFYPDAKHIGVAAPCGPRLGGANEAVLRMLRRMESPQNVPAFLEGVKNREERLMGFGHRVYKNYDPRARIIQQHMDEVFEATEYNPLVEIARELEKRALDDDYFTSRKLYPNVDFYSGIIYEALQIPTEMFTVIFA